MVENSKRERELDLQEKVQTFQEHPEEGSEMEVSKDDLTDAPNIDGIEVVITMNQALNKSCGYPRNIRQANS